MYKKFFLLIFCSFFSINSHFLDDYKDVLIKKAHELQNMCPPDKYVIYSLGNSPAYIVETLRLLENYQGLPDRCNLIAFSDRFVSQRQGDFILATFPLAADKRAYFRYLTRIGMSPVDIIERARSGKKTALLEYMHSAASLASFLLILTEFAEALKVDLNELHSALEIFNLCIGSRWLNLTEFTIELPGRKKYIIPVIVHALYFTTPEEQYFLSIVTGKDENRLVTNYPHIKWSAVPNPDTKWPVDTVKFLQDIDAQIRGKSKRATPKQRVCPSCVLL